MHYDWIIFDADGTLFDYDAAERHALRKTFTENKTDYQEKYLSSYRQVNKDLWDQFEKNEITIKRLKTKRFELLLAHTNIDVNPEDFAEQYLIELSRGTQLIDGAEEILGLLHKKVGILLMTNGIKEVQRSRLALSSINQYFSDVIISDEVGFAKPDPGIFEIAMGKMTYPEKNRVMIVGDNLSSDIQGGSDFGIHTCWYNPANQKQIVNSPTYEIKTLMDLLPLTGL